VPTYQYACAACEERLEAVQRFTDDPLTECPACGGKLRKLFSPVGIVFKGSGFYRNDSRSSPNGAKTSPANGSSTDSPGSADGKSPAADKKAPESSSGSSGDSKPAKKADSASSAKPSSTGTKVA
jgi:putative FmdB family regulatory protein